MTYMKQIAKMLDVEIGEEFKIKSRDSTFKLTEYGLTYHSEMGTWILCDRIFISLLSGNEKIQKTVLNETEQKYLLHIIRPFRDKVQYITKIRYCTSEEIFIGYKGSPDDVSISNIVLPYFDSETMYKGMKAGKDYTLEELGL